jgi:hypothetical protein
MKKPLADPAQVIVRRLLRTYPLDAITMTATDRNTHVEAMPLSHHPEVRGRRDAGIAALGGDVSISQMRPINEASMRAIATANAPTLLTALQALETKLKDTPTR